MKERESQKSMNEMVENKDINLKNLLIKEVSDNLLSKVIIHISNNPQELQTFLTSVIEAIKNEENTIDNIPLGRPYKITHNFKKRKTGLRE